MGVSVSAPSLHRVYRLSDNKETFDTLCAAIDVICKFCEYPLLWHLEIIRESVDSNRLKYLSSFMYKSTSFGRRSAFVTKKSLESTTKSHTYGTSSLLYAIFILCTYLSAYNMESVCIHTLVSELSV